MSYYIYELIDPRTDLVRYVGLTDNPRRRFSEHLRAEQGTDEKREWILELAGEGLVPIMDIRETVEDKITALQREAYWINFNRSSHLTNAPAAHVSSPVKTARPVKGLQAITGDKLFDLWDIYLNNRTQIEPTDKSIKDFLANVAIDEFDAWLFEICVNTSTFSL